MSQISAGKLMRIEKFQVVYYLKPERERICDFDHLREWEFFDSLPDAIRAIKEYAWLNLHPEGDAWAVSGLDKDGCCLEVFYIDIEAGGEQ